MGKSSVPASPDYTPIANADEQIANEETQLGQNQLDFAQTQFNDVWPSAQEYLTNENTAAAAENNTAVQQQQVYNSSFLPVDQQFASTAANYDTPAQANQQAGQAQADVANTFDAQKATSLAQLESYGIDPSQTRYGALDLGANISQAAATSAAGTQSRLNTQETGLNLQGEAANLGQSLQGNINSEYTVGANAGTAGITAANSTTNSGEQGLTAAANTSLNAASANNSATSALNTQYTNELAGAQMEAQQSEAANAGIGSLVGLAAIGALLA